VETEKLSLHYFYTYAIRGGLLPSWQMWWWRAYCTALDYHFNFDDRM